MILPYVKQLLYSYRWLTKPSQFKAALKRKLRNSPENVELMKAEEDRGTTSFAWVTFKSLVHLVSFLREES